MHHRLSAQASRVVSAVADGRAFRRTASGWAAGPLVATDTLVDELRRGGFVAVEDGRLRPGGRRPQAAGPRLLAERAPPADDGARMGARSGARRSAARSVTVNLAESPLGWLKARGRVDARQFEAGERLRGDWTVAGMGPRVTMRWDATPGAGRGGDALDPTLAQIAAKRRMDEALAAVGPGLRDVLWRIACAGEGMETAERALGWPARSGRVVLTLALDRLADHYRLA